MDLFVSLSPSKDLICCQETENLCNWSGKIEGKRALNAGFICFIVFYTVDEGFIPF
jgi:hypothetical protein